jgi:hypothetical protein
VASARRRFVGSKKGTNFARGHHTSRVRKVGCLVARFSLPFPRCRVMNVTTAKYAASRTDDQRFNRNYNLTGARGPIAQGQE